jgi:hypothetical protein
MHNLDPIRGSCDIDIFNHIHIMLSEELIKKENENLLC